MSITLLKPATISVEGYGRLLGTRLDIKDAKIIEAISNVGPRNISRIARDTGLPVTTVYRRIHMLRRLGLSLYPTIVPEKIGLTRVFTVVEGDIFDVDSIPARHWLTTYMPLVSPGGALLIHYCPVDRPSLIDSYLRRAKRDSLLSNYYSMKIVNGFNSPVNLIEYFDFNERYVFLPWDEWLKRLSDEKAFDDMEVTGLPPLLFRPNPMMPRDMIDLLILKELERDALASYVDIARKVNVPEYTVRFHYHTHISEPGIIYNYVARAPLFDLRVSYYLAFLVKFSTFEGFERLLWVLWRSPILLSVIKLDGRHYDVMLWFLIPSSEAGKLTRLFKIAQYLGLIKRFKSYVIDWRHFVRRSIPYKNFDGDLKRWIDKP